MADQTPQFRAIHRFAPMSARKARPVADLVRGLPAQEALNELEFIPRRAAPLLKKVIRSAVANAGQAAGLAVDQLYVAAARINEGPLKQGRLRFRPGPMGRACPIHKRTCHIEVILAAKETRKTGRKPSKTDKGTKES
ncbi:MAG TPA: 50S ribosomal protein L22 [Planctomycetota bacterium]|nr:50S ribosomal protein L22 [Planctomycetota bacterium]